MRKRIQKSMMLVIVSTLMAAYAITIFFVYGRIRALAEANVRYETEYLAKTIAFTGEDFLPELDAVEPVSRITLIDTDGKVLYDSREGEHPLENHLDRPEVRETAVSGMGQDVRRSDTLGEEMIYCAVRLEDGRILRVSKPVGTVSATALDLMPVMILIGLGMLLFADRFSRRQSRLLMEPINHLDLEEPLKNDVYEELSPFLQRIDEANRHKKEMEDMRKEFSANVSHELKTPLTSISGYAEIIRDGLVRPEDLFKFADRIYKEANRLVILISDIMKLSQLDENKVELESEDVELLELAEEIIQRLAGKARAMGVTLEVSGSPCHITGIRQILDEMLFNLTDNAIKYNKKGGSVRITVEENEKGKRVVVSDTGIGIPLQDQERIFERFYRVDKSHSRESGGTGLGLSIVKHGALLHKAGLEVDSIPGEGTGMTLFFPSETST